MKIREWTGRKRDGRRKTKKKYYLKSKNIMKKKIKSKYFSNTFDDRMKRHIGNKTALRE